MLVDSDERTISHLDSAQYEARTVKAITKVHCFSTYRATAEWKTVSGTVVQQLKGRDCVIHVIANAQAFMQGVPFPTAACATPSNGRPCMEASMKNA